MDILDICVTRTLECGVVPIELGLRPMYDCYYSNTVGYRGRAYINSILYGSDPTITRTRSNTTRSARSLQNAILGR